MSGRTIVKVSIENIVELEAGLTKATEAIEYLVGTGILKIPEDVSWENIENRIRTALMNTLNLKMETKA